MEPQTKIEMLDVGCDLASLLDLNNRHSVETSELTAERFQSLIACATIGLVMKPDAAFLIAFDHLSQYDGSNYLWFRQRLDDFLYIDRVIVSEQFRRFGLGRTLYAELFRRAAQLGHSHIACEVNVLPPNPASDIFHQQLGFEEIGRATVTNGNKSVRYLVAPIKVTTPSPLPVESCARGEG